MDLSIMEEEKPLDHIKDRPFAIIVCVVFFLTILAMAFRPIFGFHLGFIAMWGAITLILVFEIFKKSFTLEMPNVEQILSELDWRAIFFYVSLFALVGGLEHSGVIKLIANWITPLIQESLIAGSSLLYWVTAPIVGIVEHDAYILVFLYLIKDLAVTASVNPWPLYWPLLWAGTLGSNLTIAGAPALFVAQSLCEKEDECKISVKEFFAYSIPFVVFSLVVQYILTMIVWVIPYAL